MSKKKVNPLHLTGSNFKGDRRELDFYPTPKPVTIALMDFLKLPKGCIIHEPACGNMNMANVFTSYGHPVIASDISSGSDYLKKDFVKCDAVITNPPFKLAEQFILKAISEAPLVGMLLKSQYWHAKKRLKLFESNPPTWILPLTWRPDFLEHERTEGKKGSPTMEVCWSVWIKGDTVTKYKPLSK